MIRKAEFENFKLLRKVELPLAQFSVIVGANGSGKTTVLQGLEYLLQMARMRDLDDAKAGGRAKSFFKDERSPQMLLARPGAKYLRVRVQGDQFERFELICKWIADSASHEFTLGFQGAGPAASSCTHSFKSAESIDSLLRSVHDAGIGPAVRLQLNASRLAADHYSEEEAAAIDPDGGGLASVLQELLGARDGRFDAIERDLASIVPGVRRLRSTRARIVRRERIKISIDGQESWSEQQREYTGSGFEIEWGKVGWIPASQMSEGTLLALGILTVLHHRPPSLLLLDDMDKALHPVAQQELVKLLSNLVSTRPDLQILATTHSPYVVDAMPPENVLVAACRDERSASVRQLSEHPTWGKRRDYLQPGEFWSAVGESWVADKPE